MKVIALVAIVFAVAACEAQSGGKAAFAQLHAACQASWPPYPKASFVKTSAEGVGSSVACYGTSSTTDGAGAVFTFYKTALDKNGWTITATDPAGGVIWFTGRADHTLGGRVIIESTSKETLMVYTISPACPCGPVK